MDSTHVITALRRRRFAILAAVLGCTALTAFGASQMKREYLASATLMPQEQALGTITELATPADVAQEKDDLTARHDRLKTVSTILTSPAVLGSVIREQQIPTSPTLLREQIEVKEITSQVVRVSVKDQDPQRAGNVVNAIVDTFTRFYTDLRSREVRKQIETLTRERDTADRELRAAGARLAGFKRSGNISSLPDQLRVGLERAGETEEERNKAEARLREVTAQVASVDAALRRTPPTREVRESATQNRLVERLQLEVSELKGDLARELGVHTEEHANVKRLREQLEQAEGRLNTASARLHTSVRVVPNPDREVLSNRLRDLTGERDGLQARVASLNADLSNTRSRMSAYSGKDVDLSLLTQQYTLAEQRLTAVTSRLGQIRNVSDLMTNGQPIAIVDRAGPENPPFDLSQGRTLRLTMLAFILSLGLCVALAVALEMSDHRIRSVDDAEALTHLPVVSVVPQLAGRCSSSSLCMAAENDPAGHLAESYHFLANHILRQTLRRENTVLMGATARPGQGATTALSNLAIALARAGRQVVLVEADLRRPFLHEVFHREPRPGLTDVLRGTVKVEDTLAPTQVDNLRLMAAGGMVTDPWSLLWQPEMAQVIERLRGAADYVIINVPSATVFADAMCIAPHVDGAVMVMRTAEASNGAEQKVREWLDEVEVPVMGVVLNGVPSKDMESADFHRSYTARRAEPTIPALRAPAGPPVRRSA